MFILLNAKFVFATRALSAKRLFAAFRKLLRRVAKIGRTNFARPCNRLEGRAPSRPLNQKAAVRPVTFRNSKKNSDYAVNNQSKRARISLRLEERPPGRPKRLRNSDGTEPVPPQMNRDLRSNSNS